MKSKQLDSFCTGRRRGIAQGEQVLTSEMGLLRPVEAELELHPQCKTKTLHSQGVKDTNKLSLTHGHKEVGFCWAFEGGEEFFEITTITHC